MIVILSPSCISAGIEDVPPVIEGSRITYRELTTELAELSEGEFVYIGGDKHGAATKKDGKIIVVLHYCYLFYNSLPNQPSDEADYTFEIENGQCPCPIIRKQIEEMVV